jgi:hypothetical protein
MLAVSKPDRVNVSSIVSCVNRIAQDCAVYRKHKVSIEEIDSELQMWRVLSEKDGAPSAFLRIDSISWVNRVIRYSIYKNSDYDPRELIRRSAQYLFSTFNCNKITTDIIYDRSELIKHYISIGGKIEVRKRQHLFLDGRYLHVVEVALMNSEFKNE